jgi:hypothetical protein
MRIRHTFLALAMSAAAIVGTTSTAAAASAHSPGCRQVHVSIADGAIATPSPDTVPGGPVTITVSTPDTTGHLLQLLQLKPGGTLSQFIQGSLETESTDPATAAAGIRLAMRAASFLGGASVYQQTGPVTFTVQLSPGTYYLLDYNLLDDQDAVDTVRPLYVTPGPGGAEPHINTVIDQRQTAGGTEFVSPSTLPSDATVLVRNQTSKPLETLFAPVAPGTTDTSLQAYLDALMSGNAPSPGPFTGPPPGLLVLGPGRQAIVHVSLPPGTYALISFVHDPVTGIGDAFEGMHKIVTVAGAHD